VPNPNTITGRVSPGQEAPASVRVQDSRGARKSRERKNAGILAEPGHRFRQFALQQRRKLIALFDQGRLSGAPATKQCL